MARIVTEKWCNLCQAMHPLTKEFFYKSQISPNGFLSECKAAVRKRSKGQNVKVYSKNRRKEWMHRIRKNWPDNLRQFVDNYKSSTRSLNG